MSSGVDNGAGLVPLDSAIFKDVRVELKVKLGNVSLTVEELLELKSGSVVTLDRLLSEPVELYLNDALVARGEIVAVDDNFGVRLVEVSVPA
ncbi:MAG TPA: flagellar motor switch protein FliN [Phenylobacterium sp.]